MTIKHKLTYQVQTINSINIDNSCKLSLNISDDCNKRMYIIHKALQKQLTQLRQGTAQAKTRSAVRGGGKKPWKQKGTGRARAGSTRSPLWRGGGVIFGPINKIYKSKINKKEKKIAIQNLIYSKFPNTFIIDKLSMSTDKPSTKNAIAQLNNLGIKIHGKDKILLIVTEKNNNIYLSTRNLKNIELITARNLNIIALLKADKILITVEALNQLNTIYND